MQIARPPSALRLLLFLPSQGKVLEHQIDQQAIRGDDWASLRILPLRKGTLEVAKVIERMALLFGTRPQVDFVGAIFLDVLDEAKELVPLPQPAVYGSQPFLGLPIDFWLHVVRAIYEMVV